MRNFVYSIRSRDDQELITGTLVIPWPIPEGQAVSGTWESQYIGPPGLTEAQGAADEIGPQVGQGTLMAERDGKLVRINLNPTMNDNNVSLIGELADGMLRGRWEYATFIGIQAQGTFQARPQPGI